MSKKQQQPKTQPENAPSASRPTRRRRKKGMCLEDRPVLEPNAAGIDVGAREMFVAVPPGRDENPVRVFRHLHRRSGALNRLARAVWGNHGGSGIHRGVL